MLKTLGLTFGLLGVLGFGCARTKVNGWSVQKGQYEKLREALLLDSQEKLPCTKQLDFSILEMRDKKIVRAAVSGCEANLIYHFCDNPNAGCEMNRWFVEAASAYPDNHDPDDEPEASSKNSSAPPSEPPADSESKPENDPAPSEPNVRPEKDNAENAAPESQTPPTETDTSSTPEE